MAKLSLIFESIKEFHEIKTSIKTSMLFNLDLVNKPCANFNPIAKLVIPIGIPSKEAKAETEIDPVIVDAKMRKYCISLFVFSTHQFILLYFFKEISSNFIYISQSKFMTYVFFRHILK